jgi:hypothetical protein
MSNTNELDNIFKLFNEFNNNIVTLVLNLVTDARRTETQYQEQLGHISEHMLQVTHDLDCVKAELTYLIEKINSRIN